MTTATASRRPTAAPTVAPVWKQAPPDTSRNAASVARVVIEAFGVLTASTELDAVRQGLRIGSADRVVSSMDWIGFTESMNRISKYLAQSMKSFAKAELPVRKAVSLSVVLDSIDERAVSYAEQQAGVLIANVNRQVRENTRAYVVESLKGGLTVDQLARRLRDVVPLSSGDAAYVQKYRDKQFERLLGEGLPFDQANARASMLAGKAAERKMRDRAMTIARTELATAANKGRYAGWESGMEAGAFDPGSIKEWIAGPGACPRCQALDGMLAPWDGEFPNGMHMPPDHPACRCSAVLLPPDDDLVAEMERQRASTTPTNLTEWKPLADGIDLDDDSRELLSKMKTEGDWRLIADPQKRADMMMQESHYLLEPQKAALRNVLAGRAPLAGISDELLDRITASYSQPIQLTDRSGRVWDAALSRQQILDAISDSARLLAERMAAPTNSGVTLYRGMLIEAPYLKVRDMFKPRTRIPVDIASFAEDYQNAGLFATSFLDGGQNAVERGVSVMMKVVGGAPSVKLNSGWNVAEEMGLTEHLVRGQLEIVDIRPNILAVKTGEKTYARTEGWLVEVRYVD